MGRRKHAWTAYEIVRTEEGDDSDRIFHAGRAVEGAVIEDFTDAVFERIGQLESVVEDSQSRHVLLGVRLAIREIHNTVDEWTR
jgi:hypothetical protein